MNGAAKIAASIRASRIRDGVTNGSIEFVDCGLAEEVLSCAFCIDLLGAKFSEFRIVVHLVVAE